MTLALTMAFESVLVTTLLLAHLTIPSQLLESFGFDTVCDGLGRQCLVLSHSYSVVGECSVWMMEWLKTRHTTVRVRANQVYQEYISDRQHVHMNATIWTTLTEFVKYLGRTGKCVVEDSPQGWYIQFINRDPEFLARKAAQEQKEKSDLDEEQRMQRMIQRQIEEAQRYEAQLRNESAPPQQQPDSAETVTKSSITATSDESLTAEKTTPDDTITTTITTTTTTTTSIGDEQQPREESLAVVEPLCSSTDGLSTAAPTPPPKLVITFGKPPTVPAAPLPPPLPLPLPSSNNAPAIPISVVSSIPTNISTPPSSHHHHPISFSIPGTTPTLQQSKPQPKQPTVAAAPPSSQSSSSGSTTTNKRTLSVLEQIILEEERKKKKPKQQPQPPHSSRDSHKLV